MKTSNVKFRSILLCLCFLLLKSYLAAQTVTNTSDTGTGSLRNIISNAATGTNITFNLPGDTIFLEDQIIIQKDLTLDGNDQIIVLKGAGDHRIFKIMSGDITLKNLTICGGNARGGNGGVGSGLAGGGGAGLGGAIYIDNGDVTMENLTFINNTARGGNGGRGSSNFDASFGGAGGGGMDGQDGAVGNSIGEGGDGGGDIQGQGGTSASINGQAGGFGTGGGGGFSTPDSFEAGRGGDGGFGSGGGGAGAILELGSRLSTGGNGGFGGGGGVGYNVFSRFIDFGGDGGKFGGRAILFDTGLFPNRGGGGAGLGGAIFIRRGNLNLSFITFQNNQARGGSGGTDGQGKGGALFIYQGAQLNYKFLSFQNNTATDNANTLSLKNNFNNDNENVYGRVEENIPPISPEEAIVTSTEDNALGSLRAIIKGVPQGTKITFALRDDTIHLEEAILIDKSISIDGENQNIVISGQHKTRHFIINEQANDVDIKNLTLTQGLSQGGHGGNGGGGGGAGLGGSIFIHTAENNSVNISQVDFIDNLAIGGNGSRVSGFAEGGGGGGGIDGANGQDGQSFNFGSLSEGNGGTGGGCRGGIGGIGGESGGSNGFSGGFGSGGGGGGGSRIYGSAGGSGGFGGGGGSGGGGDLTTSEGGNGGFGGGGAGSLNAAPGTGGLFGGTPVADFFFGNSIYNGGGGAGLGGAIFVKSGLVTLSDVSFVHNQTRGGTSSNDTNDPTANGKGKGGAIFVMSNAQVNINNLQFTENIASDNANNDSTQLGILNDNEEVYGVLNTFAEPPIVIQKLFLINALADTIISELTPGLEITDTQTPMSIIATTSLDFKGSVRLELNGAITQNKLENIKPYALFGDTQQGKDFLGQTFPIGDYQIKATAYNQPNGQGEVSTPIEVSFSIKPIPQIFLIDATNQEVITPLQEGSQITLSDLRAKKLSIQIMSSNNTGSVAFALNGPKQVNRTENFSPYVLFGDQNNGQEILGEVFLPGHYQLSTTVYTGKQATGDISNTININFTLNDLSVHQIFLVNAETDSIITALSDGIEINLADLADLPLGIIAETASDAESVELQLNGPVSLMKTENIPPYSLFGDQLNGNDILGQIFQAGLYTLTTQAFSENELSGNPGNVSTLNFTLRESAEVEIYPNVTQGLLHIHHPEIGGINWQVLDQFGNFINAGNSQGTKLLHWISVISLMVYILSS